MTSIYLCRVIKSTMVESNLKNVKLGDFASHQNHMPLSLHFQVLDIICLWTHLEF